jgi:hypothetical protein
MEFDLPNGRGVPPGRELERIRRPPAAVELQRGGHVHGKVVITLV